MKLKETENTVVLGVFLAVIGLVAALALAFISQLTAAPIAAAEQNATNQALQKVLPPFDNQPSANTITVKDPDGREVIFYGALRNGKLVGFAGKGSNPQGYAGAIEGLVGLEADGSVRTVLITRQSETPGLGTVVCDRKEVKTIFTLFKPSDKKDGAVPANRILDQFAGRKAAETPWRVSKDGGEFEFQTGATVTSRAVTALVWSIARAFEQNRAAVEAALGGNK